MPFPSLQALAVTLLLAVGSSLSATEPEALAAGTEGEADEPTDDENLLAPPSPFAGLRILQARELRALRPEVAAQILTEEDGGQIVLTCMAVALPGPGEREQPGEKAYVPIFIEIDGATLLETNRADVPRIEIYAYALGPGREVVGFLAQMFVVDVRELGEAIWRSGMKFYGHLDLPPGRYELRVLVRNFQSGAVGLRTLELLVPDFSKPDAGTVVAVLPGPERRDAWLPVRQARSLDGTPPPPYPFITEDRAVTPAALPVAVAEHAAQGMLFFDPPPGERLEVGGELLAGDSGSKVADALDVELGERVSTGFADLAAASFRVQLPELEPGPYQVRLQLSAPEGGWSRTTSFQILVVRGTLRDRELLWTDLRWLLSREELAMIRDVVDHLQSLASRRVLRERERRRLEQISEGYREALAALGRGPLEVARSALADLESRVLLAGAGNPIRALRAAELEVAAGLASSQAESLLPAMMLHKELYEAYTHRRLFTLVAHSRDMVELLAELYVEEGGSAGLAAHVLASLGGYQQHANLPSTSRRLFRRALELEPTNRAALLGLAASHEKYGDYSEAVFHLRRLVEAHPSFAEGHLRLAVNLERLGQPRAARQALERTLEVDPPGWVRALAVQKLARGHLADGELGRAVELLEEAAAAARGEHSVLPLLAHVYDRMGRPHEAHEVLKHIEPRGRGPRETGSARFVYDTWPRSELEVARGELAAAASRRLQVLSRVLAAAPAPVDG